MIKLMFRCVGKTSKVSANGTTWTITFIRNVGGPVLTTKIATMNPDLAALYQEDKNYPITIKEDYDLEGLFATVPPPPPAPAPEQTKSPAPTNVNPETGEVLDVGEYAETNKTTEFTEQQIAELTLKVVDEIKDHKYAKYTIRDIAFEVIKEMGAKYSYRETLSLVEQIIPIVQTTLENFMPPLDMIAYPEEIETEKESDMAPGAETDDGRDPEMDAHDNVQWIFNCSISDPNWEAHKKYLSDDELLYCIKHFRNKSGLAKLRAEAHRRGLAIPGEEQSPRRRGRPPGSKNKPKAPRPEPEPESDPEPGPEMDPEPESESTMRNGPGF